MKRTLAVLITLLMTAVVALYVSEKNETFARLADSPMVWFVAIKYESKTTDSSADPVVAAALGPSTDNIATLKSRPAHQKPAMINFLKYYETARYGDASAASVSGRDAYARYGNVAFRTVYRLGGRLVVAGKIVEVLRAPQAGPTMGAWDDIAIMQYPSQRAILSLEQFAEYRVALAERNAGLERTRIVSSLMF